MSKIIAFFFLLASFHYTVCFPQTDTTHVYKSLEEALKQPENVFRLHLKKQKLKEIPPQIFLFSNLKELNLASNKIKEIPTKIETLTQLEILDISNNYLISIPPEIGNLKQLKVLNLSRNDIDSLPFSMGNLSQLAELILWGTYVTAFPEEMGKLKETLCYIDLRAVRMNPQKQKAIKTLFPKTALDLDRACNCGN